MKTSSLTCRPVDGIASRIEIGVEACGRLDRFLGERLDGNRTAFAVVDSALLQREPRGLPAGLPLREVDGGESAKTFAELERTLNAISASGLDRTGLLVVAGGGTVGDVGGLAAALYLRGVEHWQIPTTLLAMVDSSVGGKTAINLATGKNLVGHYWPASTVLIDPRFVHSQSEDQYLSGLGEVLKVALGLSRELFQLCETQADAILQRESEAVAAVIGLAVAAKIRVVEEDPTERGSRRLLNLGHTLGHALEADSGFAIPHGIAVARGLHFAIDRAESLDILAAADAERARQLLSRFGFEPSPLPDWGQLRPFLSRDKKFEGDRLHAVLPDGIGSSRTVAMDLDTFCGT